MKKWILKAVVQKTISFLPYKNDINLLFQKYVTKGLALNDEHFGYKITHGVDHVNYLIKYRGRTNLDCLELGTGWYPIVPITLFLSGCNKTYTIDITSHLTKKSIKETIDKFFEWEKKEQLKDLFKIIKQENWNAIKGLYSKIDNLSLVEILDVLKIEPIVGDARKTKFEDNSIDFICSNNTFEHIYPDILKDILKEFDRIVKKEEGLMSHFIDMSDHFAHMDSSINIYNFLQFSPKKWERIDNSIQPQNRLRFADFKDMYEELEIPTTEENVRKGDLQELKKIKVDDSFTHLTMEDISISHGYIVSNYN